MTSTSNPTIHEGSSKESISKDIESNTETKPKRVVTGRDILKQYFQGDPVALITYRKICNAFEVLPKWEPAAKVQFLEQFLNVSDLLDSRCAGLVTNLAVSSSFFLRVCFEVFSTFLDSDTKWLHLGNEAKKEEVFSILLSLLENRMLLSVHVRYTSFIWLYICSLDEKYATRTLDFLWSIIVRPQTNQSDIAKGHGAAAYLAAFLARIMPGVIRHGVFYALCQAFFIIFSFRYKEMVKSGDIEEVGRWGLGRIVHSPLDPLKYVVRPVGLCFGAITRSLQLVYCNHLLPFDAGTKLPFEPMFPFDSFKLKSSSVLICAQTRRFSPLAEDKSEVSSVLRNSQISSSDNHPSGFSQCGNQSSMFTIYSSSPGLRHLDSPIDMNSY
ncbi:unnamed protein product [Haemonchus placei]|uniref:CBF domain-containing protein n=1 Tax=Haemonchus placei TaxID=6290 RepID=A0A0N4WVU2_HAEPC|nr:unnamed protein product [Haemonchus placei]